MFKNAAKVQLIFCVCLISVFYSLYTFYLILKKACNRGEGPYPRLHAFFSIK